MKGWYAAADVLSHRVRYVSGSLTSLGPWHGSGPTCIVDERRGGVPLNANLWMFSTKRFTDWYRIRERLAIS